MAVVTALRARGGRVAVELDGSPWRTLPLEAVVRAGLAEGCELHRERARMLARERRRLRALDLAARALRSRDRSERAYGDAAIRHDLEQRGLATAVVAEALASLAPEPERAATLAGRFGGGLRGARALARRGFGDEALEGLIAGDEGPGVG